jgi:hypothetical protein
MGKAMVHVVAGTAPPWSFNSHVHPGRVSDKELSHVGGVQHGNTSSAHDNGALSRGGGLQHTVFAAYTFDAGWSDAAGLRGLAA